MSLFKEGLKVRENFEIIEGLPEDTQMLSVAYDLTTHGVIFMVTSDKFRSVKPGEEIPKVQMTFNPWK